MLSNPLHSAPRPIVRNITGNHEFSCPLTKNGHVPRPVKSQTNGRESPPLGQHRKVHSKTFLFLILLCSMVTMPRTSASPRSPAQASHPADAFVSTLPLGALCTPDATLFRVFAPTAARVTLRLYGSPVGGRPRLVTMTRNADGTWETAVKGNGNGLCYTYRVEGKDPGFDPRREVIDPYARAVTAWNGRGIVVHDDTPVAPRPAFPPQDAVICELHLRDFTVDPDSGIQRRGTFLALTETGTHLHRRPHISTGLDHLADMGVNTVQIMPIAQFCVDEGAQQYGWGYDALHMNSPHGGYASERCDTSRVSEAKRMIDALHRRGIRVVLDVVYNHTVEALDSRAISFDGLVPGYYYRRKRDGSYYNGSGCGNEFRSEAPMARRFIIDSVKAWVTDYGADGFRFDLMGLIDLKTMTQLTRELRAIDPNLLIYGEPWAAGHTPIPVTGKGCQRSRGFSVFNDTFRDALKGSVFRPRERGFVQDGKLNLDTVRLGIAGSIDDFTDAPVESINYVECHDNHTFWDRLVISTSEDPRLTDADRRAMNRLGAAILFTSQGIPFFQSGQEMLRSKGGDDNSYDKRDAVNMIRWNDKEENADMVGWYCGLITLRGAHPLFRLGRADEVRQALRWLDRDLGLTLPPETLGYVLTDPSGRDEWSRATVLFNASAKAVDMPIPEGRWRVFVNGFEAKTTPLGAPKSPTRARVPARSAMVLGEPR